MRLESFHLVCNKCQLDVQCWSNHYHIICQFTFVQSLMVAKAKEELEQEILIKEDEKQKYLVERAPPLNTSGLSLEQLQVSGPLPRPSHSSLPPLASQ